jgi:hypothetical protein
MKYRILFLALLSGLFFVACEDDDPIEAKTGTLEVEFALEYDGEPVTYFDPYYYEDSLLMGFSRVNFYLADLEIGDRLLEEITFLDFEAASEPGSSMSGLRMTFDDIEEGAYSELSFGIGVPDRFNDGVPADYPPENPLSLVSEYWAGWNSYIFAKYEGNLDLTGDGMRETGFSFHMGGEGVYRSLSASGLPLTIEDGETTTIRVVMELKEIFKISENEYVNLRENQGSHNSDDIDFMKRWSDNYGDAIRIEL